MTKESHNIGILGGTFDPPHLGHLSIARTALVDCELDQVLLIPARIPPHKVRPGISAPEHRLAMTKLLCGENACMVVNDIELCRQGKSYTIDTIHVLRKQMPGAYFRLIIGEDMAADFHTWKQARTLMQIAPPLVAARPGCDFLTGISKQDNMPESMRRSLLDSCINISPMDISSTAIRAAIADQRDVTHLLTTKVMAYIFEHGLYRVTN